VPESAARLLERIHLDEDSLSELKHREAGTKGPFTRVVFSLDRV